MWGKVSVEVYAVILKLRGMSRKRVCYTFDVHFGSQEEKAAFVCRLKRVRELLLPEPYIYSPGSRLTRLNENPENK